MQISEPRAIMHLTLQNKAGLAFAFKKKNLKLFRIFRPLGLGI